jgi:hypothetical protein
VYINYDIIKLTNYFIKINALEKLKKIPLKNDRSLYKGHLYISNNINYYFFFEKKHKKVWKYLTLVLSLHYQIY